MGLARDGSPTARAGPTHVVPPGFWKSFPQCSSEGLHSAAISGKLLSLYNFSDTQGTVTARRSTPVKRRILPVTWRALMALLFGLPAMAADFFMVFMERLEHHPR